MRSTLDRKFRITERGSSLGIEVLGGVSTFLALSYIFVVNPAILAQAGMDPQAVFFATIVMSAAATLAMGLWVNLPFVLAPGMEMNAYVAFFVVGSLGFTWQEALGAVFISGLAFVGLTAMRVREKVISAIPLRMHASLALSVGVFLGLVALKLAGVLQYEGLYISGFGDLTGSDALAFGISLVVVVTLDRLRVRGAVIVSIGVTSLFLNLYDPASVASSVSSEGSMLGAIGSVDLGVALDPRIFGAVLVLFLVDFYGSVAKLIGLTSSTGLMQGGRLPRMRDALMVDGAATVGGSWVGTTSLTTYVESGVGIAEGARTGLSSVICGVLMGLCLFAAPLLVYVPVTATTGALVYVGIKLLPERKVLASFASLDRLVLVGMQLIVVATFAIDRALLLGLLVYLAGDVNARRPLNPYLLGSVVLLLLGVLAQLV